MMLIYNDLNVELQKNVSMSDLIINIHEFLLELSTTKRRYDKRWLVEINSITKKKNHTSITLQN
jgi:hypothetical protein